MNKQLINLLLLVSGMMCLVACRTETKEQKKSETETISISSRIRSNPDRLNPAITFMGPSMHICRMVFPTLIEYDPVTLELSPMLAKSRPVMSTLSEGPYAGKIAFTYEIREEAIWDNGSPVTADDYVFSLKALFNPHVPAAPYRGLLNFIEDVLQYPDNPKKLTVVIREPYIKAEYNTGGIFIMPEYHYDPQGIMKVFPVKTLLDAEQAEELAKTDESLKTFATDFGSSKYSHEIENIQGCGPYRVTEWVNNERVVLTKKENWWAKGMSDKYPLLSAKPDKIVYIPVRDAATAVNMVKDESLDVVKQLSNTQFIELQKSELVNKNYNLFTPISGIYNYLGLNTKSPKLRDKRVRQALARLVDIDEIIRTAKQGMAQPLIGPIPPYSKEHHPGLKPIKLDIERAKTLLTEAGWTDSNGNGTVDKKIGGQQVEMNLSYLITPNNEVSNTVALIIKENAKKVGVNIEVRAKDNNEILQDLRKRDFEIFARAAAPDPNDFDPYQYFHTDSDKPSGSNRFGYGNAESDALIEKIRTTMDVEERRPLYLKFQEMIYDEVPMIFLYGGEDCIAIHKRFKNAKPFLRYPGLYENFYGMD